MKIGNIELTKESLIIAAVLIVAIAATMIYFVFFTPLMKEIKIKYLECKSAENDVIECRNVIESAGLVYEKRLLMAEKDVSQAIDELTKHGRSKGINFVSINPEEIKEEKGTVYKILPIKMKINSTYKQIGIFLGSLDNLEKGVVKVKNFDISAGGEDTSILSTNLVADMYLSGRE